MIIEGFSVLCLTHDMLVNVLFEHFLKRGYEVYVEASIDIPPIVKQAAKFDEDYTHIIIIERVKRRSPIDLVAVGKKGSPIIGCEVKLSFNDFTKSDTWEQLQSYVSSGYFDEVYIAVPSGIIDHVLSSYDNVITELGLGVLSIDFVKRKVELVNKAKRLERKKAPRLRRNEAWIKHALGLKLRENGYEACLEARIPKPWNKIAARSTIHIAQALNQIDMILIRPGCTLCMRSCGLCSNDIIGVEFKFSKNMLSRSELEKLREYTESGVLTKLYLAVDWGSNISRLKDQVKGVAGLWVIEKDLRIREILKPPNLDSSICAVFLSSPIGSSVTVCEFDALMCYKAEGVISNAEEAKSWFLQKYPGLKRCTSPCKVIFIGTEIRRGRPRSTPYRAMLCNS